MEFVWWADKRRMNMQKRVQRLAAIALAGCTVCGMAAAAFAATPAAAIGSTAYPTLNAAMAAAKDGETIVLQSDIDNAKETYYVGVGKGSAYFVWVTTTVAAGAPAADSSCSISRSIAPA